jgi:uncharacterized protein (UPF0261 family)
MRTTPSENEAVGHWIAERLNACEGPVRFLIPEKGLSMLDKAGEPFFDPEANETLFRTIESQVVATERRQVIRTPFHINDDEFSRELVRHFLEIESTRPL